MKNCQEAREEKEKLITHVRGRATSGQRTRIVQFGERRNCSAVQRYTQPSQSTRRKVCLTVKNQFPLAGATHELVLVGSVCVCVKIVRHALLRHAVDRGVKRAVVQREKKTPSVFVDRKGRSVV